MWLILILLLLTFLLLARFLVNPKVSGIYAVLGSGGHTGEMLRIIDGLDTYLRPTHFIIGCGDKLSFDKLASLRLKNRQLIWIPRPRNVGQSYLTSIFSTTRTAVECLNRFQHHLPKLVFILFTFTLNLCNRFSVMDQVFASLLLQLHYWLPRSVDKGSPKLCTLKVLPAVGAYLSAASLCAYSLHGFMFNGLIWLQETGTICLLGLSS